MDEHRELKEYESGLPDSISPLLLPPATYLPSPDLPSHHTITPKYVSTDLNAYPVDHRVDSISLLQRHRNLVADLERAQKHVEDLEQQERATNREIDTLEQQVNETNRGLKHIRREEVELVKLRQLNAVLTSAQTVLEQAAGITIDRELQSWIMDLHRRLRVAMNIVDELTVQRETRKRMSIVAMLPEEWEKVRLFDIAEEPECLYFGADESQHFL